MKARVALSVLLLVSGCATGASPPVREPAPAAPVEPPAPRWIQPTVTAPVSRPAPSPPVALDPQARADHATHALAALRPPPTREGDDASPFAVLGGVDRGLGSAQGGVGVLGRPGAGHGAGGLGLVGTGRGGVGGFGALGAPGPSVSLTGFRAATDATTLRAAVARALPRIRVCAKDQKTRISLGAQVSVAADGTVSRTVVTPPGALATCVAAALKRAAGPKGAAPRAATFTVTVAPPP